MKLYAVEHKTSGEDIGLGSTYWKRLTLDSQISNYYVGARALGYEPSGMLYDVIRKPTLQPYEATPLESRKYTLPTKKEPIPRLYANQRERDETPLEYKERLLIDIGKRPEFYFQRGIVVRLESEEMDAAFDTWQTADAIRVAKNTGRFPRNVDSCHQFGRMCDYWEVCSGTLQIEDNIAFETTADHPELDGKHHLPLLTTSSAKSFRRCQRQYYFGYELRRRSVVKPKDPRSFGTRFHAALQVWFSPPFADQSVRLESALWALRGEEFDHMTAALEALMIGYHERWSAVDMEFIATEKEFTAPLINPDTGGISRTFLRAGKIDAIVRA